MWGHLSTQIWEFDTAILRVYTTYMRQQDTQLHIRIDSATLLVAKRAAKRAKLSMSRWVREQIAAGAARKRKAKDD